MDTTDFDIIDDEDILAEIPAEAPQEVHAPFIDDDILEEPKEDILGEKEDVELEEDSKKEPEEQVAEGNTDNVFQEIADNLVEMNLFVPEEGEEKVIVGSAEEFADRFQKSYQKGAVNHIEQIVGQYGPEYAEAFDAIFVNGLSPKEYYTRSAQIQNYEELNLESEDAQKQVYRDYMTRQGLPTERIEAKLQKMIDLGELEEEAKDYHELLVASEKQELQQRTEQAAQHQEQQANAVAQYNSLLVSTIDNKLKDKQIDGIPLTPAKAESVKKFISAPAYKLPNGSTITSLEHFWYEIQRPENIELKIKVGLLAQEGFKTESIAKKVITDNSNKLFQNLSNKEKTTKRNSGQKSFDPFSF